jgi:solute carrier family 25 iron transporter 28/37
MDTVKQKMQLSYVSYRGLKDCILMTYKQTGLRGFYAGYTTTLTMNIPYTAVYFASYESLKKTITKGKSKSEHTTLDHLISGAGAGILSAGFTNPLDVAKTRLQTQDDAGKAYKGMLDAVHRIWKEEGMVGLLQGIKPRMLFHSCAAAICWGTYEFMKKILSS